MRASSRFSALILATIRGFLIEAYFGIAKLRLLLATDHAGMLSSSMLLINSKAGRAISRSQKAELCGTRKDPLRIIEYRSTNE